MDCKKLVNNFLFSISTNPPNYFLSSIFNLLSFIFFFSPSRPNPLLLPQLICRADPSVTPHGKWSGVRVVTGQHSSCTANVFYCVLFLSAICFWKPSKSTSTKKTTHFQSRSRSRREWVCTNPEVCEQRQLLFRLSGCIVGFMIAWLYHSMVVWLHGSTEVWTTRWHGCMVECNYMQTMRSWDQQL